MATSQLIKISRFPSIRPERMNVRKHLFQINSAIECGAAGFLGMLFALPEDWEPSVNGFAEVLPEGHTKIRGYIRQLEEAGHLMRQKHSNGTMTWFITEFAGDFAQPGVPEISDEGIDICTRSLNEEKPGDSNSVPDDDFQSPGKENTFSDSYEEHPDDDFQRQEAVSPTDTEFNEAIAFYSSIFDGRISGDDRVRAFRYEIDPEILSKAVGVFFAGDERRFNLKYFWVWPEHWAEAVRMSKEKRGKAEHESVLEAKSRRRSGYKKMVEREKARNSVDSQLSLSARMPWSVNKSISEQKSQSSLDISCP